MKNTLGIDIGGTKIYYALVDENGKIQGEVFRETTPKTKEDIENKLKEIIAKYDTEIERVGIATAGAVNLENTKIISSTGNMPLGYSDIDFISLNNNVKIVVENDANSALWAEYKLREKENIKNMIVLTLGTGVGGGIITDGKLLKGKSGAAGEMHFKMNTGNKRKCTCGVYDCFEIYASGMGLQLTYKDITGIETTTYEIIEKFKEDDESAKVALAKWSEYIAMGILGLNNIFDTELVALTGSMAQFAFIKYIEEYVNTYTITSPVRIERCISGEYAGLIGAALIANNA